MRATMDKGMRSIVASGSGALVGGFLLYALIAGFGGGVDWEDRLTFDQSRELELEGVYMFLGIVAGPLIGAPLGSYLVLRYAGAARPVVTALIVAGPAAAVTALAFGVIPTDPNGAVIEPYVVFGGWGLSGAAVRWLVERNIARGVPPHI